MAFAVGLSENGCTAGCAWAAFIHSRFAPQLVQNFTPSSNCAPQFLQNIYHPRAFFALSSNTVNTASPGLLRKPAS